MNPAGNPGVQAKASADDLPGHQTSTAARPTPDLAWRELMLAVQARYRNCGRFARSFASGKLAWDPVFRHLLEHGYISAGSRVLDIGCGQGLLASLLAGAEEAYRHAGWPAEWPQAPIDCRYHGLELMQRDVERANRALAVFRNRFRIDCADMVAAELPACDVVVILDVLHYVTPPNQQAVLARAHQHLAAGGRLLLRIGDMADRRGFAASQWADRIITAVRGHRVAPTFCRPLDEWTALLEAIGFTHVRSIPMSRGTPFANVLLVADKP
ncbi:MAG: class I SAM-dependent methyltransferase [Ideonella sp.]